MNYRFGSNDTSNTGFQTYQLAKNCMYLINNKLVLQNLPALA